MSGLLLDDQREEILKEVIRTEGILMGLADLEIDSMPVELHRLLLAQTYTLWLNLNCILDPHEKWRIDKKVISVLADLPHAIPKLMQEIKNIDSINRRH